MTTPVSDTPSATDDAGSGEPPGTKVSVRCATCHAVMAKAIVHKGHVEIGPRSPVDHDGIKNAHEGGFRLACCGEPVTMAAFDLAKLAEARAAQPRDGHGRSIRIGTPAQGPSLHRPY